MWLCEVQNDKAVVEIPSPVAGTVEEVLIGEGTVATVGQVLVTFDAPGYEDIQFKGDHEEETKDEVKQWKQSPSCSNNCIEAPAVVETPTQ